MARAAQDREDLLRDATAFTTRVQLKIASGVNWEEVFVGFRDQGAASFYFNQDPVFHFNSAGQLRRAFVNEVLIKAERGQLVELRPERSAAAVSMCRRVMSAEEQQRFCQSAARQLHALLRAIAAGNFVVVGHVDPAAATAAAVVTRLAESLEQLGTIVVAASPGVGAR